MIKRIAILPVYDSEGILYEYLEYYIRSLCEVVSKLIIVVIGYMKENSLEKLKRFSSEIYFKENKGYDAAAYKLVFESYMDIEQLNQYDELVLSNDTSFGPFVSFRNIFDEMSKENSDFWGLKYITNNYICYLQSSFIVYRKATFVDVYQYFRKEIRYDDDLVNVCIRFEQGLFKYLIKKKFIFGCYGESKGYESYKCPDYCISEERHPLMKKRCFERKESRHENCIGALLYIRDNTDYDITMILDCVRQKYNLEYVIDREFENYRASPQYFVDKSICQQSDIQFFCESNKEIYIYGTGILATVIYRYYEEYLSKLQGFIISDNQEPQEEYLGITVFRISEVKNKKAGIIVGTSKKITDMIRANLVEYENVLYLWKE